MQNFVRQLRRFYRKYTPSLIGGDRSMPERDSSEVTSFFESSSALQAASLATCCCELDATVASPEPSFIEKNAMAFIMPMRSEMEFSQSLVQMNYIRPNASGSSSDEQRFPPTMLSHTDTACSN